MSLAAGEYVSVSSHTDTERADLEREREELAAGGTAELEELSAIYVRRGLEPEIAHRVAEQLMAHDALSGQLTRTASIPTVTSTSFPINPMPATFSFQLMP
jgi:vacuolar iron transporter family protein